MKQLLQEQDCIIVRVWQKREDIWMFVVDEIRKLKNGDCIVLKNGRGDVIGNKLVIANDIWSKVSILSVRRQWGEDG